MTWRPPLSTAAISSEIARLFGTQLSPNHTSFNFQLGLGLSTLNRQSAVNTFNFQDPRNASLAQQPFPFGNFALASAPITSRLPNAIATCVSSSKNSTHPLFLEAQEAFEELKRNDPQGLALLNDELEAAEADDSKSSPCFLIRYIGDKTSFQCSSAEKYSESRNWAYLRYQQNIQYSGQISATGRPHGIGMLLKINNNNRISIDLCEIVFMQQGKPLARLQLEDRNGQPFLKEIKEYDPQVLGNFHLGPATQKQLNASTENAAPVTATTQTPDEYTPAPTPTSSQKGRVQQWANRVDAATNPPRRKSLQQLNTPPANSSTNTKKIRRGASDDGDDFLKKRKQ